MKRSTDDATSDFNADRDEAVRRIGQKMVHVIDDYAQQNGLVLVIDGAQIPVYYAAKDIDLTAEIVKRYDAANPVAGAETSPKPGRGRPPLPRRRSPNRIFPVPSGLFSDASPAQSGRTCDSSRMTRDGSIFELNLEL